MNQKLFLFGVLILLILVSGCVETLTAQKILEITRNTEEVKTFLEFYGKCENCNPTYSENYPNLIGCVEYRIGKSSEKAYQIDYWVSEACSFRYDSSSPQEKVRITVDSRTGKTLSKFPDIAYINDTRYCKNDDDCMCKSGSGVQFVGCGNFLHAPTHISGSYKCEGCKCIKGLCQTP